MNKVTLTRAFSWKCQKKRARTFSTLVSFYLKWYFKSFSFVVVLPCPQLHFRISIHVELTRFSSRISLHWLSQLHRKLTLPPIPKHCYHVITRDPRRDFHPRPLNFAHHSVLGTYLHDKKGKKPTTPLGQRFLVFFICNHIIALINLLQLQRLLFATGLTQCKHFFWNWRKQLIHSDNRTVSHQNLGVWRFWKNVWRRYSLSHHFCQPCCHFQRIEPSQT